MRLTLISLIIIGRLLLLIIVIVIKVKLGLTSVTAQRTVLQDGRNRFRQPFLALMVFGHWCSSLEPDKGIDSSLKSCQVQGLVGGGYCYRGSYCFNSPGL